MDSALLLNVLLKGIVVLEAVWSNRDAATKAFNAVKNIANQFATDGEVSENELNEAESILDALVDEFNVDIPPLN